MQLNFNNITYLYPRSADIDAVQQIRALAPFDADVVAFLNALSAELTKNPIMRHYPDVATFAFFCRKGNIQKLKEKYSFEGLSFGRGLVFHIAPSNVPVNFAYSLVCGLLAGNTNVVRVPSKNFEQIDIIASAIEKTARNESYKDIVSRIVLLRYDKSSEMTDYFSSICDVRVIWGGDETISQIRKSKLSARAYDVTFADRYSFCAINADEYINDPNPEKTALGFYNDTYLFDQNACTSPQLMLWKGKKEHIEKAKTIFWNCLHKVLLQKQYEIQPVIAVDKLTTLYNQAVHSDRISQQNEGDNLIWRVELQSLSVDMENYRCSSGYFLEYDMESLSELTPIINRKYQTLAYYGFDKESLSDFMKEEKPFGIDRIVPIGRTTDFSLIWDGYDFVKSLSRICEIT